MNALFHLSFCVRDLETTRAFYGTVLECPEGAVHPAGVDFSFFGHQITCHVDPAHVRGADAATLDGNHFGAIIGVAEFHRLASRLAASKARFIVPPTPQFEGGDRERWKMVVADPSGNAIEFKAYVHPSGLF